VFAAATSTASGLQLSPSPPSPLPETDWLSQAGHGTFTHFLNGLQNEFGRNSQGKNSTWDDCVAQFDVDAYAADAAATGARYAFITMMQGDQHLIAPNSIFDQLTGYKPGEACASRDLVLDLWAALDKRGLRLGLYWTGDGPARDPKGAAGMGTNGQPPGKNLEFVKRWSSVLQEYSVRYGDKVFAWWLDGCYYSAGDYSYNDTTLKYYHDAIRAGNPNAVLGFNNAPQPVIASGEPWQEGGETSKWEDMTAGETNSFNSWGGALPTSRWVVGENVDRLICIVGTPARVCRHTAFPNTHNHGLCLQGPPQVLLRFRSKPRKSW
jgi:alpha-L-fucosidase